MEMILEETLLEEAISEEEVTEAVEWQGVSEEVTEIEEVLVIEEVMVIEVAKAEGTEDLLLIEITMMTLTLDRKENLEVVEEEVSKEEDLEETSEVDLEKKVISGEVVEEETTIEIDIEACSSPTQKLCDLVLTLKHILCSLVR